MQSLESKLVVRRLRVAYDEVGTLRLDGLLSGDLSVRYILVDGKDRNLTLQQAQDFDSTHQVERCNSLMSWM